MLLAGAALALPVAVPMVTLGALQIAETEGGPDCIGSFTAHSPSEWRFKESSPFQTPALCQASSICADQSGPGALNNDSTQWPSSCVIGNPVSRSNVGLTCVSIRLASAKKIA